MVEEPLRYAREHYDEFLANLQHLVRIPSVSTLPEHVPDMRAAAAWLVEQLQSIGLRARIVAGEDHPLVYAESSPTPGAPTLLAYGHYDVQPADPLELWQTPPFDPTIRAGNLYARGASDDKGQVMTIVDAAESFLRTSGTLPINLKLLIEGQEECGGEVVEEYVGANPQSLKADVAQIADGGMYAPGIPTIDTGLRGNVYTEVRARGALHDLHSGIYGGAVPNPLVALGQIIAGLKNADGRITIPGFYDDVRMPADDVLKSWRGLPFDEEAYRRDQAGATALVGESGYTVLERTWARPTLDVHGIKGGFIGEGAKTVIPAEAAAKISMRIVPNQRTERIFELFRKRVLDLRPPGIDLEVVLLHGGDPVVVSDKSPYVESACEALAETFGRQAVLARSGGSIPIVSVFKESLGIETVLMGWGLQDDNLHAPNEKFSLENFRRGIEATIRFWSLLGQLKPVE